MFYAHFVLSKKGALAKIWLAAHWDKKLTKANIFETNIESSVEAIMQPQVKLALRTSGHLLLGVVRIYSRKAKYLLADCNDAIVKMKMVFRPGAVDLPEEGREAAITAVTLQENFYEFEAFLPTVTVFDAQATFDIYQSQREDITLREDFDVIPFFLDDGFGDIGFDHEGNSEHDAPGQRSVASEPEALSPGEMQTDEPCVKVPKTTPSVEVPRAMPSGDVYGFAIEEVGNEQLQNEFGGEVDHHLFADVTHDNELFTTKHTVAPEEEAEEVCQVRDQTSVPDQTTLITNDVDAFALGPIDATTLGTERKAKKKRKLIIDEQKLIASDIMRAQLGRAADLVVQLDLAPPSKKLMLWKNLGGVDKLMIIPGKRFPSTRITKMFTRNLVTRTIGDEEYAADSKPRPGVDIASTPDKEIGREVRRGASTAGPDVRDMSRVSTSLVADITDMDTIPPPEDARISLPWADVSAISAASDIQMPRVSLPAIDMSSLVEPPPLMDVEPMSVSDLMSVSVPASDNEARPSAFDRTLRSTSPDITLQGGEEIQEDSVVMHQRSGQLLCTIQESLEKRRDVIFSSLVENDSRKQVAVKFYTLLVLKKQKAVDVSEKKSYGDIRISRGPAFDSYITAQ